MCPLLRRPASQGPRGAVRIRAPHPEVVVHEDVNLVAVGLDHVHDIPTTCRATSDAFDVAWELCDRRLSCLRRFGAGQIGTAEARWPLGLWDLRLRLGSLGRGRLR